MFWKKKKWINALNVIITNCCIFINFYNKWINSLKSKINDDLWRMYKLSHWEYKRLFVKKVQIFTLRVHSNQFFFFFTFLYLHFLLHLYFVVFDFLPILKCFKLFPCFMILDFHRRPYFFNLVPFPNLNVLYSYIAIIET